MTSINKTHLFNLRDPKVGDVHQFFPSFLNGLNCWLVRGQLRLQTLVFLLEILDARQVTSVIVRSNEEFLLPENEKNRIEYEGIQ